MGSCPSSRSALLWRSKHLSRVIYAPVTGEVPSSQARSASFVTCPNSTWFSTICDLFQGVSFFEADGSISIHFQGSSPLSVQGRSIIKPLRPCFLTLSFNRHRNWNQHCERPNSTDAMNDYRPFVLIERTLSEVRTTHWPFKGSWQRSAKRGMKLAKLQRWVQKARKLSSPQPH